MGVYLSHLAVMEDMEYLLPLASLVTDVYNIFGKMTATENIFLATEISLFGRETHTLNTSRQSDICISKMRQALAQIMACLLLATRPLSEPLLAHCQLDPWQWQQTFNWNSGIFIQQNAYENVVRKMSDISSWPECVRLRNSSWWAGANFCHHSISNSNVVDC